ncbi:hypothetical protein KVV02_006325 [Mortierella alpina]|uniref:Uncharacterized protein n=1 Tax=Mortierella alpina TaxID=64518 RepID=A0A9P8D359_MORAP|nr:hypothetical protein KVV02_006325 [Mortierella alpina]
MHTRLEVQMEVSKIPLMDSTASLKALTQTRSFQLSKQHLQLLQAQRKVSGLAISVAPPTSCASPLAGAVLAACHTAAAKSTAVHTIPASPTDNADVTTASTDAETSVANTDAIPRATALAHQTTRLTAATKPAVPVDTIALSATSEPPEIPEPDIPEPTIAPGGVGNSTASANRASKAVVVAMAVAVILVV